MPTRPTALELDTLRTSVAAPGRRTMSRREVLGWHKRWSPGDVHLLDRHLERTGAARFSRTADDGYIRCFDAHDRLVMVVAPGYLVFERPWANHECDPEWLGVPLSTLGAAAPAPSKSAAAASRTTTPRPHRTEQQPAFCPRCFLQLTTTGVCGSCD